MVLFSATLARRFGVPRSSGRPVPSVGPRRGTASRESPRSFSSCNTIVSTFFRSYLGVSVIISPRDQVLVTGSTGFLGSRVVASLLDHGFFNIRCLARPSSDLGRLEAVVNRHHAPGLNLIRGNLLSRQDCEKATSNVAVVYHLAAGTVEKSFAEAFMDSVITTPNLPDAVLQHGCLQRVVRL